MSRWSRTVSAVLQPKPQLALRGLRPAPKLALRGPTASTKTCTARSKRSNASGLHSLIPTGIYWHKALEIKTPCDHMAPYSERDRCSLKSCIRRWLFNGTLKPKIATNLASFSTACIKLPVLYCKTNKILLFSSVYKNHTPDKNQVFA